MKVIFTPEAAKALYVIADFVESQNTPGSGKRYALKFRQSVEKLAQPNVQYALCSNKTLAYLQYSCGHYNNWVIAFKIENGVLKIYLILHSSTIH